MKLTTGMIVSAEQVDSKTTRFMVETKTDSAVTLRENVSVIGFDGFDEHRLKELYKYLIDRPSLMDDYAVKEGVIALRCVLGISNNRA
jgi:hypothetical protein